MGRLYEKPIIVVSLLALLSAFFFFYSLGNMALTDPDETFYAQSAREMLDKGEWATTYLYGRPQFEKPILFYWLARMSYSVFGVNEFAARLPSAAMGLAGIIAIYWMGALLFSKRAGLLSAVILGTNIEYIMLSRACVTDMTLFVFLLLGLLFFLQAYLKEKSSYYILSAVSFALAVLTKGPIAVLLPGAAILVYLILVKDLKALKKISYIPCIIAFAAVALPWYVVAYKMHGKEFIDVFFGFHNVTRFLESEHKIGSQWYYNIPILFGGFMPWSIFLPLGFWRMFKKSRGVGVSSQNEKKGSVFILIWFAVIFIFFSISSTKLPTYIFPCFASAALMVGMLWDDFLSGKVTKAMKVSYYLLPAVVLLGSIGVLIFLFFDSPLMVKSVFVCTLLLCIGIALSLASFIKKKYLASFLLIVVAMVLCLYPVSRLLMPEVDRYESSKGVALKLNELMKDDDKFGAEDYYSPGVAFYTGRFPVNLDKHHNLSKFVNSEDRGWIVMKEKNHRQLYDNEINPDFTKPSYLVFTEGKRAIVTNRMPEGNAYLIKREKTP